MTTSRHHDATWSRDFVDQLLVRCPRCARAARLTYQEEPRYRLACAHCGHTRDWKRQENGGFLMPGPGPRLAGFELELWLQVPCCGSVLWGYNPAHVAELEALVGARLRERQRHPERGWANSSLASRLPKWVKSAKNRPEVLRALAALRSLAEQASRS